MTKKIMIVDDDLTIIYSVKAGLDDLASGYEIISANSGKECFDLLNKGEMPDLILLDIMMPDMSGWEAHDKLKENKNWSNIPIVFLTARTDNVAENAGKFFGEDYIEKPFKIDDLRSRIDKIINK